MDTALTTASYSDCSVSAAVSAAMKAIAEREGIPPHGITILGGKPYVNVTGLDCKIQRKAQEENLRICGILCTITQMPTEENGYMAVAKAQLLFRNEVALSEALKASANVLTPELVRELKDAYTQVYEGTGAASPASCEAIAYAYITQTDADGKEIWKEDRYGRRRPVKVRGPVLVENIIMMAERRATNRAKREATGTGLTSVDELPVSAQQDETETAPAPANGGNRTDALKSKLARMSEAQNRLLHALLAELPDADDIRARIKEHYGVEHITDLTAAQARACIDRLKALKEASKQDGAQQENSPPKGRVLSGLSAEEFFHRLNSWASERGVPSKELPHRIRGVAPILGISPVVAELTPEDRVRLLTAITGPEEDEDKEGTEEEETEGE